MDVLTLSRIQFGLTVGFRYIWIFRGKVKMDRSSY
jgi:hypothetical protein